MRQRRAAYLLITIFLSILFLSSCFWYVVEASDITSAYNRGVVYITVTDKNGKEVGKGSGFIIEQDGIIATSCSVLSDWYKDVLNKMTIAVRGRKSFPVDDILSYDRRKNIALIKISARGLSPLNLDTTHKFRKGEDVLILSPSDEEFHKVYGRIKNVSGWFSEITVPVTPEKSGSPIVTRKGEVAGIATFILKKGKKLGGIVSAQEIKNQLMRYKEYVKRFQKTRALSSHLQMPAEGILPEKKNGDSVTEKIDDYMYNYLTGCDQMRRLMYADAVESFQKAVAVKPDSGEAYVNLGNLYYKLGKYTDAETSYEKAIRITPGIPSLNSKLGTVLILLGEYKRAIDSFNEVVKIDPKNADAYYSLGIAYFLDGNRPAAMNVYKVLKELDRNRAENLLEMLD